MYSDQLKAWDSDYYGTIQNQKTTIVEDQSTQQ